MKLTSSEFEHNGKIPSKFTCQGQDMNPTLQISGVPENAKSLTLIVDDPDAPGGTWDHWIVINIDPKTSAIQENSVPSGATQCMNDFKKVEWGGPCPPSGEHRYFFKLYALDTKLALDSSATKEQVEQAMKGHILDKTELVGLYSKT